MSDTSTRRPATARREPIGWLALAAFLLILSVLAIQLRAGRDPALGSGPAARAPVRQVLLRRIVRRTVIVRVIPSPADAGSPGSTGAGAAASVSTSSAFPAAPPAAPTAPAPVTRTS